MVNYVYYLVCLCFGILGVKYFAYSCVSVFFIHHVFQYEWYCLGSAVDS